MYRSGCIGMAGTHVTTALAYVKGGRAAGDVRAVRTQRTREDEPEARNTETANSDTGTAQPQDVQSVGGVGSHTQPRMHSYAALLRREARCGVMSRDSEGVARVATTAHSSSPSPTALLVENPARRQVLPSQMIDYPILPTTTPARPAPTPRPGSASRGE